ncbi:MAG: hypothetical protein HeimAB125_14380 [Candidatus Heimdallarchaeota archaeon AB_125]|nr:MAG: hypothetical protein HeimAB125_14380 [Candidatus Heimdallarchaeota archaeon AB_125]
MTGEIFNTEELSYTPKDIVEIVNDFRTHYSNLESKMRHFILTQPTFLNELRKELKTEIGFLSPQKKDMALAIYGIIITDDLIKKYKPLSYAEDISALLEATDKKMSCTDDEFIGLLASFVNCIKAVMNSSKHITHHFIELSSLNIEDNIIQSILILRNFVEALTEAYLHFEVGEFSIDLRFIAAIFAHALEKIIQEENFDKIPKSAGRIYQNITSHYPLSDKEEFLFDLIHITLIQPYYEEIQNTFKNMIKRRQVELEEKYSIVKKEYQKLDQSKIDQGRIEQILAAIEQILFETLKLQRDLTETKRLNLGKNIEMALKRMAIEEFGVQDIADQQRYMQYLLDTWFSIFEEYPQMAIPIIDIRQYAKFVTDPHNYIEENKETMIQQLQFKIRRLTKGERFTPNNLGNAFAVILFEALSNPTVQSLSFDKK